MLGTPGRVNQELNKVALVLILDHRSAQYAMLPGSLMPKVHCLIFICQRTSIVLRKVNMYETVIVTHIFTGRAVEFVLILYVEHM